MLDEITESPGFWILGGGGTAAIVLGWLVAKRWELMTLPLWQMGVIILSVWIVAALFSSQR